MESEPIRGHGAALIRRSRSEYRAWNFFASLCDHHGGYLRLRRNPVSAAALIVEPVRIVVITGVSGSGKTTVGQALAARLGWRFCDADDLHSRANIERLHRNVPLDDEDRAPWLKRVREVIEQARAERAGTVIACSALKERYRRVLADGIEGLRFVFLTGDPELLRQRLERRQRHFAGPGLLDSQLAEVEPPRDALTLDVSLPVDALVDRILADIRPPEAF